LVGDMALSWINKSFGSKLLLTMLLHFQSTIGVSI